MIITYQDLLERGIRTDLELDALGPQAEDDFTNRRRVLAAELMIIRDYERVLIGDTEKRNTVDYLTMIMKTHAEKGHLNYAAGMERIIKWISEPKD